jgi:hypothetical protein
LNLATTELPFIHRLRGVATFRVLAALGGTMKSYCLLAPGGAQRTVSPGFAASGIVTM